MFTKLFNSIRETISRETIIDNHNKQDQKIGEQTNAQRRPSVTDAIQNNDTHSIFSTDQSTSNKNLGRNNSISVSEPISINDSKAGGKPRRAPTLFGISNDTADDYVQKDLISSSWS